MAKRRQGPLRTAFALRRELLGLSQQTVADRAALDKGTISRFERGVGVPPVEQRAHMAEAYGQTLAEFNDLLHEVDGRQSFGIARPVAEAADQSHACADALAVVKEAEAGATVDSQPDTLLQFAAPLLAHCARTVLSIESPEKRAVRVGAPEVQQVEVVTEALRALDSRYGGGACRGAIVGHTKHAEQLLAQTRDEGVRQGLLLALADLNALAGWVAFDTGDYREALTFFGRALEQAPQVGAHSLVASTLYSVGRVYLHCQLPRPALRFLQLGVVAAQDSGCRQTMALLLANEAWAHGALGNEAAVQVAIDRAQAAFGGADRASAAPWVRFFVDGDLYALEGYAYAALKRPSAAAHERAVLALTKAAALRGPDRARSRMFNLSALAAAHFAGGDIKAGVEAGTEALLLSPPLSSVRVAGRLDAMRQAAMPHRSTPDVKDLLATLASSHALDPL